jgi:hypothetical protein
MIQVLCYSCSTHIANTDVDRIDWPLTGEMFSPIYPGWYLRPGPLNLDVFCPACQMFPFNHDPNVAGGNAVGKALNVRGADGKPVVMTVKEILINYVGTVTAGNPGENPSPDYTHNAFREPAPLASENGENFDILAQKPVFPCPSCGAKKRFHKKGCTAGLVEAFGEKIEAEIAHHHEAIAKTQMPDPHLATMEARVSSGPDRDETPTTDDLKDLERDRERRASGRPEPELRPGEGYAPPVM